MPKIPRKIQNPYSLSLKQQAVINDVVEEIKNGKGFNLASSTAKFYRVKNIRVARSISSENLSKTNFREALAFALQKEEIVDLIEKRLGEGLDAVMLVGGDTTRPIPDYKTRLKYIQEICKIAGSYHDKEIYGVRLNLDIRFTKEELDKRMRQLQSELAA